MEYLQIPKKLAIFLGLIVVMITTCSARMLAMTMMVTNSKVFPTPKKPIPGTNDAICYSI